MRSAVVLLALVVAAAAVPAVPRRRIRVKPVRLPLSTHHQNDETARDLEVLVPQEPAELSQVAEQQREIIRPVRQSSGGFAQELPRFGAGSPLPGGRRRQKRQISEELRQMLTAPYSGRLPSSLEPLMRTTSRLQRAPGPSVGISVPADQPQQPFQTQHQFQPQPDFRPLHSFQARQDKHEPLQQEHQFEHENRQQHHEPPQEFHQEDFRREGEFPPPQNFHREPPRPPQRRQQARPPSKGFVPENGGFPARFFSQIRRTFLGNTRPNRSRRDVDAPNTGEAGFFEMPPGFPSIGSLGGFGDSFDRSDSEVNNIEVIPIQFPASTFQVRQDTPDTVSYAQPAVRRRRRRDVHSRQFSPSGWGPPRQPRRDHGHGRAAPYHRQEERPYQLPLSPVPYRPPFDDHLSLPPPPPPPPTTSRPQFFRDFSAVSEERNSLLGSGDYVILRGGTFVDAHRQPDNHLSPHRPAHSDRRPPPNIFENFRDFAEFAHGSEDSYRVAAPEADGMSGEQTRRDSVRAPTEPRAAAANIQDILSEITNDVQADSRADSTTSHVKKRVLQDKRRALKRHRDKQARLDAAAAAADAADPMLATY